MTDQIGFSGLLVALLLPTFAVGQEASPPDPVEHSVPTGTVEGVVFDSIGGAPLGGGDVFLWNTSYQVTTDEDGAFVIDDVPPGEYSAVFYHPRLMRLGISTGSSTVEVAADETTTLRLTTPSMVTVQQTHCALEGERTEGQGMATGQVRDPDTGVALPGAQVILTWTDAQGEDVHKITSETDSEGWYRVCSVPLNRVVGARARFFHRRGPHREFQISDGKNARVDIMVAQVQPSDVTGKVLESETSEPVRDAEVRLLGTSYRGTTNKSGRFRFEDLSPGLYTVEIKHLAYGTRTEKVRIGDGVDVQMEIPVSMEPVEVDPIVVAAESRPVERAISKGGTLISREEVDRVRHRSRDADIIRAQAEKGIVVKRHQGGLCVGFMPGQARMIRNNNCQPADLYVDDVRMTVPEIAMDIPAEAVDRIILFRPIQSGNLFGMGSGNGVIQIYTRSADPRWRNPR